MFFVRNDTCIDLLYTYRTTIASLLPPHFSCVYYVLFYIYTFAFSDLCVHLTTHSYSLLYSTLVSVQLYYYSVSLYYKFVVMYLYTLYYIRSEFVIVFLISSGFFVLFFELVQNTNLRRIRVSACDYQNVHISCLRKPHIPRPTIHLYIFI